VQEKLELSDQKLEQYAKLPEMEEELKQRMEALTQVRAQVGNQWNDCRLSRAALPAWDTVLDFFNCTI